MKKEYLAEILAHQQKMVELISQACKEDLLSCSYLVQDFDKRIISDMRWALFTRKDSKSKIKTSTRWSETTSFHDAQDLLQISFPEILKIQQVIKSDDTIFDYPIFSKVVEQHIKDTLICVSLDYEDLKTDIKTSKDTSTCSIDDLLEAYSLELTLPEYDTIFPDCHDSVKIPKWMFEYIDIYEEFSWQMRQKLHRIRPYVQIGGYGQWIQGFYTDTYIAQVNNDVGDAGAVFICCSKEGKFDAWVDMH